MNTKKLRSRIWLPGPCFLQVPSSPPPQAAAPVLGSSPPSRRACSGSNPLRPRIFVVMLHSLAEKKRTAVLWQFFSELGLRGFEPPTSWSRTKRASPCATARCSYNFYFSFRGFASVHPHRRVYGKKPVQNWTGFTGATGLEPAISGLTGQRDNQLRYAPVTVVNISKY